MIVMHTHHFGTTVVNDVRKFCRIEAKINRDQRRTNLGDSVEGFELYVGIRSDIGNSIALGNPQSLKSTRPTVTSFKKFLIGKPTVSVYDGFSTRIQTASASLKLERRQRSIHVARMIPSFRQELVTDCLSVPRLIFYQRRIISPTGKCYLPNTDSETRLPAQ